jgi:V8-like Glu-specific endopeptidase
MLKYPLLIISSVFLLNSSQAQFDKVNFPNELTQQEINQQKLNGISCQLIKRSNSPKKLYKSTSFFINKNFLITSEHNLKKIKGNRVIKIAIFPSKKGKENPYGSIILNINNENYFRSLKRNIFKLRWRKRPYDMAVIYIPDSILDKNEKLKNIDYIPILENTVELKKGDTIYCAGYPATDIYSGQDIMTMVSSTVRNVYKNHFTHRLETYRGNSGSPIMVKRNKQFYVVGVNSIVKNGTWFNKKRRALIRKWMKELRDLNMPE